MIVDVRTYNIAPRKMASYLELFEQYALPVQRKYIGRVYIKGKTSQRGFK